MLCETSYWRVLVCCAQFYCISVNEDACPTSTPSTRHTFTLRRDSSEFVIYLRTVGESRHCHENVNSINRWNVDQRETCTWDSPCDGAGVFYTTLCWGVACDIVMVCCAWERWIIDERETLPRFAPYYLLCWLRPYISNWRPRLKAKNWTIVFSTSAMKTYINVNPGKVYNH